MQDYFENLDLKDAFDLIEEKKHDVWLLISAKSVEPVGKDGYNKSSELVDLHTWSNISTNQSVRNMLNLMLDIVKKD